MACCAVLWCRAVVVANHVGKLHHGPADSGFTDKDYDNITVGALVRCIELGGSVPTLPTSISGLGRWRTGIRRTF
jgi:hypothetical protein